MSANSSLSWIHAGRWLTVLLLLAAYPLSSVMPATWGWENGPVENLQLLVLLGGLLTAWAFSMKVRHRDSRRAAAGAVLLWAIAAARELSWGAVFLSPILVKDTGPTFSARLLPYHAVVDPMVVMLVIASVLLFALGRLPRMIQRQIQDGLFPWLELGIVIMAALVATYAEGHLHLAGQPNLPEVQCQLIEELCELVSYMALYLAQARFFLTQRGRAGL